MKRISNGNYQKANKDLLGLKSGNSFLFLFFYLFSGMQYIHCRDLKGSSEDAKVALLRM